MSPREWISMILMLTGIPFFVVGSIGLLRFPDVYTRLHALTKLDNVGLGFVVLSLTFQASSLSAIAELWLIYVTVLASSTTSCHLIARTAHRHGVQPWKAD
jgi:multicomponent Na+:H+ antiporter subunit G